MNKKFKSMIAACGTLAVLASLIPMASYAATSDTENANIQVKVMPTITIDATTNADLGEVVPNTLGKGTFTATVTSNKGYTLSLSAKTAADTALRPESTSVTDTIPALTTPGPLSSGTTAWGIQTAAQNGTANYTGITASPAVFYTSSTGGDGLVTTFNVGIMVKPTITSGVYKTTVTVTANTATSA